MFSLLPLAAQGGALLVFGLLTSFSAPNRGRCGHLDAEVLSEKLQALLSSESGLCCALRWRGTFSGHGSPPPGFLHDCAIVVCGFGSEVLTEVSFARVAGLSEALVGDLLVDRRSIAP